MHQRHGAVDTMVVDMPDAFWVVEARTVLEQEDRLLSGVLDVAMTLRRTSPDPGPIAEPYAGTEPPSQEPVVPSRAHVHVPVHAVRVPLSDAVSYAGACRPGSPSGSPRPSIPAPDPNPSGSLATLSPGTRRAKMPGSGPIRVTSPLEQPEGPRCPRARRSRSVRST